VYCKRDYLTPVKAISGSTLVPIAIAIVRYQFLRAPQEAKNAASVLMTFHPGFSDDGMLVVGIPCLAGAPLSLIINFRRTRKAQ
jgi:hypothetical protein